RELTVQAYNGTNSGDDLVSINSEIVARVQEINRIAKETQFNGVNVLNDAGKEIDIQVGSRDSEVITIKLAQINSGTLFDGTDGLANIDPDSVGAAASIGILDGSYTEATADDPTVAAVETGMLKVIDKAISMVDTARSDLG